MKIQLDDDYKIPYGEDPHRLLAISRRSSSTEVMIHAEKAVLIQYRLRIREEFEKNKDVESVLQSHKVATEAFAELKNVLSSMIRSESEDLFDKTLHELLEELEELKKRPASLYLIDEEGKTSAAVKPEHFYKPPDFVDESGKLRKSTTIVHPGLSVQLAMKRHETSKESSLIQRYEGKAELALQHLKDSSSIARHAIEILSSAGIEIANFEGERTVIEIEFGQERQEGILQGFNPKFHRASAFSSILSKRILEELQSGTKCNILDVSLKTNSKKRWYVAKIEIPLS